jgi:hypothetical protein
VPEPAEEYRRRAAARRLLASERERKSITIGNLRLAVVAAGLICIWAALAHVRYVPLWSPLIFFAVFIALGIWHERVVSAQRDAEKSAAVYDRGLSRIEDRWAGGGATGERFRTPDHLFADDLDLFGRGSLFELLSVARTPIGEAMLADWLLSPSPVSEIPERQQAVRELSANLDLREDLAVLGADVAAPADTSALLQWAEAGPVRMTATFRAVTVLLTTLALAATVIGFVYGVWTPLIVTVAVEGALVWRWRKRIEGIVDAVSGASADLALASVLLGRLEKERFNSPLLQRVAGHAHRSSIDNRSSGTETEVAPSEAMARLKWLVNWADSRHNMLVRFLDVPLLFSLQVAFAVEGWRRTHGQSVRHWLEALGEIEALASLAAYSYEHPQDPFPELLEGDAPLFAGEDIGHPLLPAKVCVRNSVTLGEGTQVLLVSGSNMSGKSTFLRTIGINAVLAQSGGPVRARSLRMTGLHLGASIRVTDSLQAGRSGFYAEITRLRRIMDLTAESRRVLFLADELLHGTNSHDRRIGAEGLIEALLKRGAIGVVTTHDLAITAVAADGVHNAHFQDELRDGRMAFDYRLREGVVTRSNALELMRAVGLDVREK